MVRNIPPPRGTIPAIERIRCSRHVPRMVRRSTPQKKTDDRAFPIRVKFRVPERGFGGLCDRFHSWLRDEVGTGRHVVHSASAIGADAIAIYFVELGDAVCFVEAFPEMEMADSTTSSWYYSPNRRFAMKGNTSMDAAMMLASAAAIAERIRRSLDNPRTEHVILTRDEAALTLGLVDGLKEVLEREKPE